MSTAPTATLTEFLLARIAEDEELLDYGSGKPLRIHVDPGGNGDSSFPFHDRWLAECAAKRRIVEIWGGTWQHAKADAPEHSRGRDYDGDFIRVGRKTLRDDSARAFVADWYVDNPPNATLCALASVYADHPDYREAWR